LGIILLRFIKLLLIRISNIIENLLESFRLSKDFLYVYFQKILKDNPGYENIKNINKILNKEIGYEHFPSLNKDQIELFRYSPTTNTEVERSFSNYKFFFRSNRCKLTDDNCLDLFYNVYNTNCLL